MTTSWRMSLNFPTDPTKFFTDDSRSLNFLSYSKNLSSLVGLLMPSLEMNFWPSLQKSSRYIFWVLIKLILMKCKLRVKWTYYLFDFLLSECMLNLAIFLVSVLSVSSDRYLSTMSFRRFDSLIEAATSDIKTLALIKSCLSSWSSSVHCGNISRSAR